MKDQQPIKLQIQVVDFIDGKFVPKSSGSSGDTGSSSGSGSGPGSAANTGGSNQTSGNGGTGSGQ
uniref:Uncharacterized protein n=1 Tax=Kwoniella dejecticola CBS 10117 TaxID=1296121 RepID=A0A1A6A5T0_9TREE|nr:uncharacterized protein I303_04751 [Kwoniella dejecticola CBS 10117]OBR85416.1 hypothetical protein I303_04751 [Kwoniella dejecticola CBS 10117]